MGDDTLKFRKFMFSFLILSFLILHAKECFSKDRIEKIFICDSPDSAELFWREVQNNIDNEMDINEYMLNKLYDKLKKDAFDHKLRSKYYNKIFSSSRCKWIEAQEISPFMLIPGDMMAVTDGNTNVWFTQNASFGWISTKFYMHFKK